MMRKMFMISLLILAFALIGYSSSFLITDGVGFTNIPEINDTGITVNIGANYNLGYLTIGANVLGIYPLVYTANNTIDQNRFAFLSSIGYLIDNNYSLSGIIGLSNVPFGYSIDNGYVPVAGITNQISNIFYTVGSYLNLTILSPIYINGQIGIGAPIFIFTIGESLN